jgi:hypothetical protein
MAEEVKVILDFYDFMLWFTRRIEKSPRQGREERAMRSHVTKTFSRSAGRLQWALCLALLPFGLVPPSVLGAGEVADDAKCPPTRADSLGPFYVPGAPVRSSVGTGYELTGTVRSFRGCEPVARATIEVWLADPGGRYDADHRATLFSAEDGGYRFESNRPEPYGGRPPHIHLRVSAPGFRTLVTQHYPRAGESRSSFDLVLVPGP